MEKKKKKKKSWQPPLTRCVSFSFLQKAGELSETEQLLADFPVPKAAFIGFTYRHSEAIVQDTRVVFDGQVKVDPDHLLF